MTSIGLVHSAANVEAARDAGVNLSFWSGNEVYWKTRWEPSISAGGQAYRTFVHTRKPGPAPSIRTTSGQEPSGTRVLRLRRHSAQGVRKIRSRDTMFQVDSYRSDAITIPYDDANLRFWRNTSVANCSRAKRRR